LKNSKIIRTNLKKFKEKKFGDLTNINDEFDFEDDNDVYNYDENLDVLDDVMSIDETDENFKNKAKLKNENEDEIGSGEESDEVSLD